MFQFQWWSEVYTKSNNIWIFYISFRFCKKFLQCVDPSSDQAHVLLRLRLNLHCFGVEHIYRGVQMIPCLTGVVVQLWCVLHHLNSSCYVVNGCCSLKCSRPNDLFHRFCSWVEFYRAAKGDSWCNSANKMLAESQTAVLRMFTDFQQLLLIISLLFLVWATYMTKTARMIQSITVKIWYLSRK